MQRNLGKFTVGQEVWMKIEEGSNAARRIDKTNIDEWYFTGEVVKVGRKYITVKIGDYKEEQFNIDDDYREVYTYGGANYKLYLTKEEIINEMESERLYYDIKSSFEPWKNYGRYSLETLKKVYALLK